MNSSVQPPPKWNTALDVPLLFDPTAFLYVQVCLTACVGLIAVLVSHRALKLATIPMALLWSFYYVVGLVFHFSTLLTMDATGYGFLGTTAIHVFVEGLLCIKTLTMQEAVETTNRWGQYWVIYFCVITFATWCLWQPLSLFVFGSVVALPMDSLTLPASLAYMARADRGSSEWYLGLAWFFNTPIVALIFAQLLWGAKTNNNYAGLTVMMLQIQYIAMGIMVIKVWGRLDNQYTRLTSNVVPPSGEPDWTIQQGFLWMVLLLIVQVAVSVISPLAFGLIDLDMIVNPWCASIPGIHGCK